MIEYKPGTYALSNNLFQENTVNGTIVSTGYDTLQTSMTDLNHHKRSNITNDAKVVRDNVMHYFVNEDKLVCSSISMFNMRPKQKSNDTS